MALKQVGIDEKIASTDNKIVLCGAQSEVLLQNGQKIKFTQIEGNKASIGLDA